MPTKTSETAYSFPICRFMIMASACLITLIGAYNGIDPYIIFLRVISGSMAVGVGTFFINLWFSSLFM